MLEPLGERLWGVGTGRERMAMPSRELTPGMIRDIKVQRKKREGREEREKIKKEEKRVQKKRQILVLVVNA